MKITIITITYNAEAVLERTIKSVLAQTDQNFEYIIIDGNSKDKTLQIVEKYRNRVNQIVSEPDKGLYDAMNKGIAAAKGDFLWFMNAGDEIYDMEAIAKLNQLFFENPADIYYGDTYFVDNESNIIGLRSQITPHKLPEQLTWQQMQFGMKVCHQSFIARKTIVNNYIENNLSADIDWEINCLKKSEKIQKLNFVLSKYLVGGISNKNLKRSLIDRFKVLKTHFGLVGAIYAHFIIAIRGLFLIAKNGKYW